MNNNKKNPPGASARLRYPAGSGKLSGRFVVAEILNEFLTEKENRIKANRRQLSKSKKLAHDRAVRKAARERRGKTMAFTDGHTPNSQIQARLEGWASTAVGKLREKTHYKWHGVYRIEGGEQQLKQIMDAVGSDVRIKALGGGRYEMLLIPYLLGGTPAEIETVLGNGKTRLQDAADTMTAQFEQRGGTVTYLGAFYNNTYFGGKK